jgi:Ni,Fe-hydrogenase maturation factor
MAESQVKPILVLGVGNELLCDEGVGVHRDSRRRRKPWKAVRAGQILSTIFRGAGR